MQFQADLLRHEIVAAKTADVSALGVACLAGKVTAGWQTREALRSDVDVIEPDEDCERVQQRSAGWPRALHRTLIGIRITGMDRLSETRLLVKIASLYYEQDLNQADIASRLSLSQSFVSRAIKRCHADGIVRFSIAHPTGTYVALENELQARYGIDQMIIVHVDDDASDHSIKRAIGSAAAAYLQNTLSGSELIGLSSWSSSICAMVEQMHPKSSRAGTVIQILGGVGHNENLQANILTNDLARTLQCTAHLLPTKSISRNRDDKQTQLEIEELADVVKQFPDVELAIVGIGTNEPSDLVRKAGIFTKKETETELKSLGAVGDLCLHYFDRDGKPILDEVEDPVISMTLSQLKACPCVVALAGGLHKVEAISGALAGRYLDVLITDCVTASALSKR